MRHAALAALLLLLLTAACGAKKRGTCVDADGDAHGAGCAEGPDCNDHDRRYFDTCPDAAEPPPDCDVDPLAAGCPCLRGASASCFPAEAESGDVGACKVGKISCIDELWSECVGAVLPHVETCNGKDDDCDGFTDEGVESPCGGCDKSCRGGVWGPPSSPFQVSEPLDVTSTGELTLHWQPSDVRALWVPNTDEGTVSKLDPLGAREVARYRTRGAYPIRVAVDHRGDAWVLDGTFGGTAHLTKFATERSRCRDGNGDGLRTSQGPDALPLGQDECVLLDLSLTAADDARALAVDGAIGPDSQRAGDVWLGCAGSHQLLHLDGEQGGELGRHDLGDARAYLAAFDLYGVLWLIDRDGKLLRFDPTTPDAYTSVLVPFACYALEGLSIDPHGQLLLSGVGCESMLSFEPRRNQWRRYNTPDLLTPRGVLALASIGFVGYTSGQVARMERAREPYTIGMANSLRSQLGTPFEIAALTADGVGNVWAISTQGGPAGVGLATRLDPESLQVTAQVALGKGPRAGGDFSGLGSGGEFAHDGSTTHVFGGCGREGRETDHSAEAYTQWKRLRVAALSGAGAKVTVSVRRADNEAQLPAADFTRLGELPTGGPVFPLQLPAGGVLEVKLELESAAAIGAPRVTRVGIEWDCPGPD